jgi:hypothetical protein
LKTGRINGRIDMRRRHNTITVTVEGSDGNEYDVDVEYKGYSDPGRTYGPPENCYPPEGEIVILKMSGLPDGVTVANEDKAMEYIDEQCFEDLHDYCPPED